MTTEEDNQAKLLRDMGMSKASQVTRTVTSNPANGGTTGYDPWFREQQVEKFDNGEPLMLELLRSTAGGSACYHFE